MGGDEPAGEVGLGPEGLDYEGGAQMIPRAFLSQALEFFNP